MKSSDIKYNFIFCTTFLFILEIVLMHFVYSSQNISSTPLSNYAIGKYWYIITSGLILISVNYFLISSTLPRVFHQIKSIKIGARLLFITAICTVFIAIFPNDTGFTVSVHGILHKIAASAHFTFLAVSAFFISAGMRKKALRLYGMLTLGLGMICAVVGILIIALKFMHSISFSGIIEKSLIILILLWIIYSGETLRMYARSCNL